MCSANATSISKLIQISIYDFGKVLTHCSQVLSAYSYIQLVYIASHALLLTALQLSRILELVVVPMLFPLGLCEIPVQQ